MVQNLQTIDSSLFIGQSNFFNDGAQLYIIFQPLYYTLERPGDNVKIASWKSKGLSTEKLISPITTDNSLPPSIRQCGNKTICLVFKGICLK